MSRGYVSSVVPVAVFLLILFMVLPGSAADNTTNQTTAAIPTTTSATNQTTAATSATTGTTNQTTTVTPTTTGAANQTTVATATTTKTSTPRNTTVAIAQPATIRTTVNPPVSAVETRTTGNVMVYSSPTGASILIDGVYSGTTPGTVYGVPTGTHILRLSLSGYYDYEGSIYIVAGQTAQGYGTLHLLSQVISAAPTPVPTPVVPVIAPVVTTEPVQEMGLLENSSIVAAIMGVIAVLITTGVSVFTHVKPPKK